jgi:hydroxymethylpyrimidine pyrophosphatase-like HAD family hydrolase
MAAALVRWREAGGQVVLVTGETRGDLLHFAPTGLFDRIVGENGGVILRPPDWRDHALGPAPSPSTVHALRRRVHPIRVGRVLLGTEKANEKALRWVIGPGRQLIQNGKDVMALPTGVTKGTGLAVALQDLYSTPDEVVGIGNAQTTLL